jgi:hypothetical protein
METINFSELVALHQRDPAAFEAKRQELIAALLAKVPAEHQARCIALQARLDAQRAALPPAEFMSYLLLALNDQLENLADQLVRLRSLVDWAGGK